jgi:hypothetical protein
VKRVVPQLWGTSNGTFITDRVGNIEISFVEYLATRRSAFRQILQSIAQETMRQYMIS